MYISGRKKGFSLIELLVVIAIIGILSSIVLVSLSEARIKSRNSKRLADMAQISKALEFYISDKGYYPTAAENDNGGWETSPCDNNGNGRYFMEELEIGGYMSKVPRDPLDKNGVNCSTGYRYYRYSAGNANCATSSGDYYILGISDMESSSGAHKNSPGFSCPLRNWQGEVEWVTGRFTN
jgi:type II secretion system protein G